MSDKKMEDDRRGMIIGGSITLGVGIIFLLSNLGYIPHISRMWPLFPIIVGISLIIGAFQKGKKSDQPE